VKTATLIVDVMLSQLMMDGYHDLVVIWTDPMSLLARADYFGAKRFSQ
jgi:hypothetical protein